MKKAFTILLIALIAISSAFATGSTETTGAAAPAAAEGGKIYDGVEITMWSMWNAAEIQGQIIQEAAAAFEEETGCHVNIEFRGRDDNSYALFNNMTKEWSGGKLVSIPEQPNMGGIFYDKAKFEAAGITETPTTWDEFLAVCQQLVDAGFQPLALDATYSDFNFGYHLDRYIGEARTRELSLNGGWSQEPGVIAAANDIIEFVKLGYLADGAPDEFPASENKIGFENVAMVVCADYVTSEVNNNTGANIEWGVFPYPTIPVEDGGNGSTAAYAGTNSLAIASYSENPQAAFDFIMYLTTGEFDQKRADQVPQIPADPRNNCTSLDGAVESLMSADSSLSWTMGINANGDLRTMLKDVIIQLFEGRYATGENFAAAMDALY